MTGFKAQESVRLLGSKIKNQSGDWFKDYELVR